MNNLLKHVDLHFGTKKSVKALLCAEKMKDCVHVVDARGIKFKVPNKAIDIGSGTDIISNHIAWDLIGACSDVAYGVRLMNDSFYPFSGEVKIYENSGKMFFELVGEFRIELNGDFTDWKKISIYTKRDDLGEKYLLDGLSKLRNTLISFGVPIKEVHCFANVNFQVIGKVVPCDNGEYNINIQKGDNDYISISNIGNIKSGFNTEEFMVGVK